MAAEESPKPAKSSKEELDIISNRIAIALAKRENLIKSWTASSSRRAPTKTEEELDAEDAALFRNQPPYLGVGAPIPSNFLISDAERNNKSLRMKLFPTKGLKASKLRDAEEKAASVKRGLHEESSDEEEGRSGLGKAKKAKMVKASTNIAGLVEEAKEEVQYEQNEKAEAAGAMTLLATPPFTLPKNTTDTVAIEELVNQPEDSRRSSIQAEVSRVQRQKQEISSPRTITEARREKLKRKKMQKQKLKRKQLNENMQK